MTLTDQIKKIAESKPFYAVAGAGGVAVDNLRTLRHRLRKQLGARRVEVRETAKELPGKARETVVKSLPARVRKYADTTATQASRLYDDLAVRGRKMVTSVSHEAAQELREVSETAKPEPASKERKAPATKATPRAKKPTRA
ncbi:hypothetical protein ABT294_30935 [Nonomuraea sp. NPDC000554]|uniref:hypothetical protein n=1 Tax=Nonomuraea sp. NPDC000554 TaxID=3154259 RepID=UPI00332381BD